MNIGILAVDSNFPNLALMKISAYHKARGDQVEWYNPLCNNGSLKFEITAKRLYAASQRVL